MKQQFWNGFYMAAGAILFLLVMACATGLVYYVATNLSSNP